MLPMFAKFLVVALITSVVTLAGLFAGVQPRSRLSFGPTVAPFGPQLLSLKTPVFVAGLNAPSTMLPGVTVVGSMIMSPPSQVAVPQPPGCPRIGTDT